MSTYVIGDVHGCFDELKKLLKKISFNPSKDSIIFTGDLVNRGNQSLEVLEFCMKERSIDTVLGNHDVFLIKNLLGKKSPKRLKNICAHKNKRKFLEWLVKKPFLISKKLNGKEFIIVHAGIPPSWSIKDTKVFAKRLSKNLKNNPEQFVQHAWGNKPNTWNDKLNDEELDRVTLNYLTRMRFCNASGKMDLKSNGLFSKMKFKKWFQHWDLDENKRVIFGHWAALNGKTLNKQFIGLDTACVWGGKLTAFRLDDETFFQVKKI